MTAYNHIDTILSRWSTNGFELLAKGVESSEAADKKGRHIGAFFFVFPTGEQSRPEAYAAGLRFTVNCGQLRDGVTYGASAYTRHASLEEAVAHGQKYLKRTLRAAAKKAAKA